MESRVVPAMGDTMTRFSPNKALIKEDFPTLGFPTTAIWVASTSGLSSSEGNFATIKSNKSPRFNMFTEDMGMGSPNPNS